MAATVLDHMARKPEIDYEEGVGYATRDLRRSGGSTVVAIPPDLLDMVGFEEGEEVEIRADMDAREITLSKPSEGGEAAD